MRNGTFVKLSIPTGIGREAKNLIYGFVLRSHIATDNQATLLVMPVAKKGNDISSEMVQGKASKLGYRAIPEKTTTVDSCRVVEELGYLRGEYTYILQNIMLRYLISDSVDLKPWVYRLVGQYINADDKSINATNLSVSNFFRNFPQREESVSENTENTYKVGDIVLIDFNTGARGSEIRKVRFGLIIKAENNLYMSIPISSRIDQKPYHEFINPEMVFGKEDLLGSMYYEQEKTISEHRIKTKVGILKEECLELIKCNYFMSVIGGRILTEQDLFNYLAVIIFNKVDKESLLNTEFETLVKTISFIQKN